MNAMAKTASDVVIETLIEWLQAEDYERLSRPQRIPHIEAESRIWEYGKWCMSGHHERVLGYKPQIRFRGSRPESTFWDSIPGISDEEAMIIHDTMKQLSVRARGIIVQVYINWYTVDEARERMRMRSQDFFDLRWEALNTIANALRNRSKIC